MGEGVQEMDIPADRPEGPVGDAHLPAELLRFVVAGLFNAVEFGIQHDPFSLTDDVQGNYKIVDIVIFKRLIEIFPDGENRPVRADARGDQALRFFGNHFQTPVKADRFLITAWFSIFCPSCHKTYSNIVEIPGDVHQSFWREHGVCIGEENDIPFRMRDHLVETGGFPFPFRECLKPYTWIRER